MPTTTNFGWTTPADTDLVKDGASAIRTLGNGIDTSMVDLKGGTTGQILSKNSNTDMDFVWIANDQGDITAVTAGTGISGGGTSGAVTITNSMATTIDAKGDLIVGTGADTFARLGVGTNNQILVADSTTATGLKWATAAASGKVLQVVQATYSTATTIASTTYTDTGLSASITPSATSSKILVMVGQAGFVGRSSSQQGSGLQLVRGATTIHTLTQPNALFIAVAAATEVYAGGIVSLTYLDSPSTTSATTYKTQARVESAANSGSYTAQRDTTPSVITLIEIGA